MDRKKQAAAILRLLRKKYPAPRTALSYKAPFELLAATILSAQSTDKQVNRITAGFFKKYRTIEAFATAPLKELESDVSSINFYRNKAKNIRGCAVTIIEKFGGTVPRTMEELVTLPGVARKTANIVLSNAFGINEGIAVDTHVKRLAQRLDLSEHDDPVKIERDLMAVTPKKDWGTLSHLLIFHGREICTARNPRHGECVLYEICPSRKI